MLERMPVPVPWMHAFVDVPAQHVGAARQFWQAATGWPLGDPWETHPEFRSFQPPGSTRYLHLQSIGGAPRIHLDLVGDTVRDVARLEELGAKLVDGGDWWQVMASPAGLPFCVCGCDELSSMTRPRPVEWTGGHRSRLVQLCVDVPAARYDIELAFWRAATGWEDEPVDSPEFHRLVHRDRSPLQLLVQRLGEDDPDTHARAHLDLGTDDMAAEVARMEELGATQLWPGNGFIALRDPTGLPFCVTGNRPDR